MFWSSRVMKLAYASSRNVDLPGFGTVESKPTGSGLSWVTPLGNAKTGFVEDVVSSAAGGIAAWVLIKQTASRWKPIHWIGISRTMLPKLVSRDLRHSSQCWLQMFAHFLQKAWSVTKSGLLYLHPICFPCGIESFIPLTSGDYRAAWWLLSLLSALRMPLRLNAPLLQILFSFSNIPDMRPFYSLMQAAPLPPSHPRFGAVLG